VLGGLASSPEILVTARSPGHAAPSRRPRLADIAEIREGDASETLTGDVPDDIDFVFLDGAETLYRAITELLEPRLARDGLIVADNADGAADYLAHVRSSGRYVSTSLDRASSCPC
jgi:predicted O-methyltransferase YrrM